MMLVIPVDVILPAGWLIWPLLLLGTLSDK
jgi:hypothetical protein